MEKNAEGGAPRPRVGVGVMIQNNKGEVLMGLRQSSHGAGEWAFPGGHLEFGETLFETARREVKEETDLDIEEFEVISLCDEMRYIKSDGKHYLNISLRGIYAGGEVKIMEPQKCPEWKWFPVDALPEELFESTALTIRNFKSGILYQPDKGQD
jgi:8-oxo-dGTP diphosphatase